MQQEDAKKIGPFKVMGPCQSREWHLKWKCKAFLPPFSTQYVEVPEGKEKYPVCRFTQDTAELEKDSQKSRDLW